MSSEIVEDNTDNMSVAINIDDEVPSEEDEVGVCVCRVPKSLSCGKPEAFTPHFVGLGPYHHTRFDLTMTDKLKSAAARRILKHTSDIHVADVQTFYHSSGYEEDKLLRDIAIDGFFLLALLRWSLDAKPQSHTFFLTGKHGMPLVNTFGVELTIDAIIRDVFMLENQIPTDVLHQISQVSTHDEIQLGPKMQSFCQKHCPLVHFEKVSENAKHAHLLDLMYHLVAPKPKPKPKDDADPKADKVTTEKPKSAAMTTKMPESTAGTTEKLESAAGTTEKPESAAGTTEKLESAAGTTEKPESAAGTTEKPESAAGTTEKPDSAAVTTRKSESPDKPAGNTGNAESTDKSGSKTKTNRLCSICFNILLFFAVIGFILWYLVYAIWRIVFGVLRFLYGILEVVSSIFVKVAALFLPMVENSIGALSQSNQEKLRPVIHKAKETDETLRRHLFGEKDTRPAVTIQSVTELDGAGIHFKPAEGGIEDLKFDVATNQFSLPVIQLDANSEVIMRNLVAYESLTRPTYLIFTRYIEIMRAIIDTPEDVKLLVNKKIIVTKLSDQVVTDLFNGMSTSIRPTETPELEEEIKKVKAKFEESQWLQRVTMKYVYSSWKILTLIAALSFFVLTAVQTYCSIYACASTSSSNLGKLPAVSDNGFISSI